MKLVSSMGSTNPDTSRGFSLVEMMVAIVIGLILLAGVSSVMVSTKRTYNTQDSLGRLQENARIAMVILERALRNAGYIGCSISKSNITNVLDPAGANYSDFDYGVNTLMEGSESGGDFEPSGTTISAALGTVVPRPNTDLFVVRGASTDETFKIQKKAVNESAALQISTGSNLKKGEILIVSDCSSTDIFQVSKDASTSGGFDQITHNSGAGDPGNDPNRVLTGGAKLSKIYGDDAKLMKFQSTVYYIGTGKSGEPALFRRRIAANAAGNSTTINEELVEGIENLQVLYGEDTNGDRIPDAWHKALDPSSGDPDRVINWDNIVAVRFGIIARALANLNADRRTANRNLDTKQLDIDGDGTPDFTGSETTSTTSDTGVTLKDRLYDRRMFRTTVLLRNFVNREAS